MPRENGNDVLRRVFFFFSSPFIFPSPRNTTNLYSPRDATSFPRQRRLSDRDKRGEKRKWRERGHAVILCAYIRISRRRKRTAFAFSFRETAHFSYLAHCDMRIVDLREGETTCIYLPGDISATPKFDNSVVQVEQRSTMLFSWLP